ncbi:class F sortase, partial [Streptomyces clavuligerus]
MKTLRRVLRHRPAALVVPVVLTAAVATGGCSSGSGGAAGGGETAGRVVDHGPATPDGGAEPGGTRGRPERGAEEPAAPVRVTIPSVGVDSALMRLGLNKDGTVEVPPPAKGMTAGWYTGGAVPGEPGASVIIGHNSTVHGKAVFHDLKKIAKGAEVTVRNASGDTARFTVTHRETVSKKAFPTQRVYGATNGRELRLITCDGAFDAAGHPVDNLI